MRGVQSCSTCECTISNSRSESTQLTIETIGWSFGSVLSGRTAPQLPRSPKDRMNWSATRSRVWVYLAKSWSLCRLGATKLPDTSLTSSADPPSALTSPHPKEWEPAGQPIQTNSRIVYVLLLREPVSRLASRLVGEAGVEAIHTHKMHNLCKETIDRGNTGYRHQCNT